MSEDKYIFKMDNLKAFPKGKTSRLPLDLKLQRKCLGSPLYKTLKGLYKRDGGSLPNRYNIVTRLLAHNRSLRKSAAGNKLRVESEKKFRQKRIQVVCNHASVLHDNGQQTRVLFRILGIRT